VSTVGYPGDNLASCFHAGNPFITAVKTEDIVTASQRTVTQ